MEETIIMFDSPEAAELKTYTGWVSKDGRFFINEDAARYSGCTHKRCECGDIMKKGWTKCSTCRSKSAIERYMALPFIEWDGNKAVCTVDGSNYFFSEDDLLDYMDNCEDEPLSEINLIICAENKWSTVNEDYWCDMMPENDEGVLPDELQKALDNLNDIISKLPAQSYSPGNTRTSYKISL